MNPLYDVLKWMHKFALRSYFRSVSIRGEHHFKTKGPVLLAVNHPSAFMDPIIVATFSKRRVAFLTAAEFFYNRFLKWFYAQLGMIPVYRPHVMRREVEKNLSTFQACYEHLEKGGALIVFPEGSSKTEYHIRPNKTGMARIAFETAERNGFELDIDVLPVGLVYDNPHVYGTNLILQYGEPIKIAQWYALYKEQPKEAVRILTLNIEAALKHLTWHLDEAQIAALFESCKKALFRKKFSNAEEAKSAFLSLQTINAQLHIWHKQAPELLQELEEFLNHDKGKQPEGLKIQGWFAALAFSPLALYGFLNNFAALTVPYLVLKMAKPRHDFIGSVRLLSSLSAFLIFSLLQTYWVYRFSEHFIISLVYFFSIALSGWFAHRFLEWFVYPLRFSNQVNDVLLKNFFKERDTNF